MRQQLDNLYVMLRSFSRVAVVGFLLMAGLYYFGLIGDVLLILATAFSCAGSSMQSERKQGHPWRVSLLLFPVGETTG
jgi:hypothetical protein